MPPPLEKDELLESEIRQRIYAHVRKSPGLHMRQIQRDLSIPLGTLEYHLYQMERHELVVTREDGRFKAYYPNEGRIDRRDRDLLYYLRQQMPRRVALQIVDNPGIGFKQLVAKLPVAPSTLSFHLKKLTSAGIVQETRVGREKTYEVPEAERVRKLVLEYRSTFLDDIVDRFADAWLDLGP
jgi:predicted transcriptional regulator